MENDLMMENLFPSNVFRVNKSEYVNTALEVFKEGVDKAKKEFGINLVHPVVMTGLLQNDSRLNDLSNTIVKYAWSALNAQGYNMDMFETVLYDLWGQEHNHLSSMDYHTHNTILSGFYFLEVPENSMSVIFHDPRAVKIYASLPERDGNQVTFASNMVVYTPAPGDIFITNSWLPHSFTRNSDFSPVKFMHFSVGVNAINQGNCPVNPESKDERPPETAIVV